MHCVIIVTNTMNNDNLFSDKFLEVEIFARKARDVASQIFTACWKRGILKNIELICAEKAAVV